MNLYFSNLGSDSNIIIGDDIYLSAIGNDSNDGSTPSTAWKTLSKLESNKSSLKVDSTIYFNGGDRFEGSLDFSDITNKNITLTSYGTGKGIITGTEYLASGFTHIGGNIWEYQSSKPIHHVIYDGDYMQNCRYPKHISKYSYDDNYVPFTGYNSTTKIVVPDFIGMADLTGGQFIWQTRPWIFEQRTISLFNSATGEVTIDSEPNYTNIGNNHCIVSAHESLLTTEGEWFFDSATNKLKIYSTTEPTNLYIQTIDDSGIKLENSSFITIDNLKITGYNENGVSITENSTLSESIIVNNCDISNVLGYGIENLYENTVNGNCDNNLIYNCGLGGIKTWNTELTNNTVYDTSFIHLWNQRTINNINGIFSLMSFGSTTIELNNVYDVGYGGIRFEQGTSLVRYNQVRKNSLAMDDGGAIYTYSKNRPVSASGSIVEYNILEAHDTPQGGWASQGLYLDEESIGVTMRYNTVIGYYYGFQGNKNFANYINFNKIYESVSTSYYLSRFNTDAMNGEVKGNHFYHIRYGAIVNMNVSNIAQVDDMDNNVYWDTDGLNTIYAMATDYTLAEWQALGKDTNSTDQGALDVSDSRCYYNDTENTIVQTLEAGNWLGMDGVTYTGSVSIDKFESIIVAKI